MRPRVSAIVLAGGRSTRFGADKLAHEVDGRPLVAHAIAAVAQVADEVLVVVAADRVVELPPTEAAPTRLIRDTAPFAGPLAGLRDGAAAASGSHLLVVAGDMPALHPEVLRLLLAALDTPGTQAAVLGADDRQPLPAALVRDTALAAATALLAQDRRSLMALLGQLHTVTIPAQTWRVLDPDGATLRDIDTPDDLPPPGAR